MGKVSKEAGPLMDRSESGKVRARRGGMVNDARTRIAVDAFGVPMHVTSLPSEHGIALLPVAAGIVEEITSAENTSEDGVVIRRFRGRFVILVEESRSLRKKKKPKKPQEVVIDTTLRTVTERDSTKDILEIPVHAKSRRDWERYVARSEEPTFKLSDDTGGDFTVIVALSDAAAAADTVSEEAAKAYMKTHNKVKRRLIGGGLSGIGATFVGLFPGGQPIALALGTVSASLLADSFRVDSKASAQHRDYAYAERIGHIADHIQTQLAAEKAAQEQSDQSKGDLVMVQQSVI